MKSGISREKLLNGLCFALDAHQHTPNPCFPAHPSMLKRMSEKLRAGNQELPEERQLRLAYSFLRYRCRLQVLGRILQRFH